ncbi:hypothetical protein CNYM01_07892 [Colletotrichum nymphaeae SA-01]|uniref:Uncharacterized protein n=1 Tax=Colletotrichum nymphaeae SA-01 TaxID=1460502 RepID=A0A135THI8_9PEZI|nr:hypothetical protein CNYM01_07892 [Colletotrichum nymphaeae SA-01]
MIAHCWPDTPWLPINDVHFVAPRGQTSSRLQATACDEAASFTVLVLALSYPNAQQQTALFDPQRGWVRHEQPAYSSSTVAPLRRSTRGNKGNILEAPGPLFHCLLPLLACPASQLGSPIPYRTLQYTHTPRPGRIKEHHYAVHCSSSPLWARKEDHPGSLSPLPWIKTTSTPATTGDRL